jgi:hypothetical protein
MGHYVVRFPTNGVSDPDPALIEDSAGILDVDTPITRAGQSQYRLNLKDRWVKVYAQAQLHEEQPAAAHVYDVSQATNQAAAAYVRVIDLSAAGVINADTTGWEISVMMDLTSWLGRGET